MTPQYRGLQSLFDKYKSQGFVVLGFPCNQFARQEPGSAEDIAKFVKDKYGVTFPLMEKADVNGRNAQAVYKFLKASCPGLFGTEAVMWNFTKFLVGRDGMGIKRFSPSVEPVDLEQDIEAALEGRTQDIVVKSTRPCCTIC